MILQLMYMLKISKNTKPKKSDRYRSLLINKVKYI